MADREIYHWLECEEGDYCQCEFYHPCPDCLGYGFTDTEFGGIKECENPHCEEGLIHEDFLTKNESSI